MALSFAGQATPDNKSIRTILAVGDSYTFNAIYLGNLAKNYFPNLLALSLSAMGLGYRVTSENVASGSATSAQIAAQVTSAPALVGRSAVGFGTIYSGASDSSPFTGTKDNIVLAASNMIALGIYRIVVLGMHYWNFSSNDDTHASPDATNASLRVVQSAAATDIDALCQAHGGSAIYVNLWNYMDALIQNGTSVNGQTFTQGDFGWHVADANSHLNAIGQIIVRNAILAQMPAAWLTALAA